LPAAQTLSFITVVFGSQSMIYAICGRPHLWSLRPSMLLACSSVADVAIAVALAITGIAMARLSAVLISATLASACLFAVALDPINGRFSRGLELDERAQRK
jgi:H+-transporting ATPase